MSALVIVPESFKVTLIYGLGYGTTGIGTDPPIADKFLVLSGEGGTLLGSPNLRVLPPYLATEVELLCPTDQEIQDSLTQKGAEYGAHLLAPRFIQGDNKEKLLQIPLIPS